MLERELEQKAARLAQKYECIWLKNAGGVRGMPDRVLICPEGQVIWVELKTTSGSLSKVQKFRHAELTKLGHLVYTFNNIDSIRELFDRHLEKI